MLVFVASPFKGDIEKNKRYLKLALKDSIKRGECPYAPHAYLVDVLDDSNAHEREIGMKIGHEFLKRCDRIAVYQDLGISSGMNREMDIARLFSVDIELRNIIDPQLV